MPGLHHALDVDGAGVRLVEDHGAVAVVFALVGCARFGRDRGGRRNNGRRYRRGRVRGSSRSAFAAPFTAVTPVDGGVGEFEPPREDAASEEIREVRHGRTAPAGRSPEPPRIASMAVKAKCLTSCFHSGGFDDHSSPCQRMRRAEGTNGRQTIAISGPSPWCRRMPMRCPPMLARRTKVVPAALVKCPKIRPGSSGGRFRPVIVSLPDAVDESPVDCSRAWVTAATSLRAAKTMAQE